MKQLIITLSLVFAASLGHSNDELEKGMKVIGEQFKVIATSLQQKNVSMQTMDAVAIMQDQIVIVKPIFPDSATTEQAKDQYTEWMDELLVLTDELEVALADTLATSPQDTTKALAIFVEINELRKKAHSVFKLD